MLPPRSIDRWQLVAISFCFCLMRLEATITLGVVPVYVVQLGADSALTGLFMAVSFLGVTLGNILGGWLADRSGQRKRITQISTLVWIPAALLMTRATTVTGIILTSGLMWLPGGITIAVLNSILGLSAGRNERGRVFGWVALAGGAGTLIAGLIGGVIAERWGFPVLFVIMAVLTGVLFFISSVGVRDVVTPVDMERASQTQDELDTPAVTRAGLGSLVYLLLLARLFAGLGKTVSDLGRPLVMLQLNMNTTDVSTAIAFSAAATLPLPLILGWLSDRAGRKRLLILFYGIGAVGILVLSRASVPWHFWLSAALVALVTASNSIGKAYIVDLSDPRTVGRSLSLFASSNFVASMIGLGSAGYVMQWIGTNLTLLLGAFSLVIAVFTLLAMRPAGPRVARRMMRAATPK